MKRILLLLFLSIFFGASSWAEVVTGSCGTDVTYSFDSETGKLTISGTGAMSDYSSSSAAPWTAADVKTVDFGEGVTSIGSYAFAGCVNMKSIDVPETITTIGSSAFTGCSGLESMTLPFVGYSKSSSNSEDAIFGYIFGSSSYTGSYSAQQYYKSNSSTTYYIPSSLKTVSITGGNLNYGAFYNCKGLTSVDIPSSVTSIGNYAFYYCSGLTSLVIPSSVTSIGSSAFYHCTGLTSVVIPSSVTSIGNQAFYSCTGLTSVEIGESVTSIGEWAFYSCTGLTSLVIPSSVTSIGNYAFYKCYGLTSLVIPSSVTSIGENAFEGCSGLTSLVIPSSVTVISIGAFQSCSGLTSVVIPSSVTTIGSFAFEGCSGLTSFVIPSSVTTIATYAFQYCTGLTSLVIPSSVTTIGSFAFYGCSGLTSIQVEAENTVYDSRENCNAIIETATNTLLLGSSGTTIPCSVTRIGGSAFGRSGPEELVIPNSVTSLADYAFSYCYSKKIAMGNGVTVIPKRAFQNSLFLEEIKLPDNLTQIGEGAFYNCKKLTSIVLPKDLTYIGGQCFSYISNAYVYAQEPPTLGKVSGSSGSQYKTFNQSDNATIHVLPGCGERYQRAEGWNLYTIVEDLHPKVQQMDNMSITTATDNGTWNDNDWYLAFTPVVDSAEEAYGDGGYLYDNNNTLYVSNGSSDIRENMSANDAADYLMHRIPAGTDVDGNAVYYIQMGNGRYLSSTLTTVDSIDDAQSFNIYNATSTASAEGYIGNQTGFAISIAPMGKYLYANMNDAKVRSAGSGKVEEGAKNVFFLKSVSFFDVTPHEYSISTNKVPEGIVLLYKGEPINILQPLSTIGNLKTTDLTLGHGTKSHFTTIVNSDENTISITFSPVIESFDADHLYQMHCIPNVNSISQNSSYVYDSGTYLNGQPLKFSAMPATAVDQLSYYWRIIPQSDGTFIFQNAKTGNYIYRESIAKVDNYYWTATNPSTYELHLDETEGNATYWYYAIRDSYMIGTDFTMALSTLNIGMNFSGLTLENIATWCCTENSEKGSYFEFLETEAEELVRNGDVNLDGNITSADITGAVNFVLQESTTDLAFAGADYNYDQEVSVTDVIAIVHTALTAESSSSSQHRLQGVKEDCVDAFDTDMAYRDGECIVLPVRMTLDDDIASFQFDLILPEGMELSGVAMGENVDGHQVVTCKHNDTSIRVICYSLTNTVLPQNGDAAIVLKLKAGGNNDEILINNVELVRPNVSIVNGANQCFAVTGSTITDIDEISAQQNTQVYDLQGRRINAFRQGANIVNGKKILSK